MRFYAACGFFRLRRRCQALGFFGKPAQLGGKLYIALYLDWRCLASQHRPQDFKRRICGYRHQKIRPGSRRCTIKQTGRRDQQIKLERSPANVNDIAL